HQRAQDLANALLPGLGVFLALLIGFGGLVFNIGNIGGTGLGLNALTGIDVKWGAVVSCLLALWIFWYKEAGRVMDVVVKVLGFLMIGFIMYFLTERLTRQEFFTRLKLRTEIAAKARFEANKLSGNIYEEIRKQQLQTLPEEKEYFLEVEPDRSTIKNVAAELPEILLSRVLKSGYAEYTKSGVYYVGIIYPAGAKSYAVIISALDPVGKQDLQRLKGILVFSFLIMCLLSFFIGWWFSNQFTKPLSKMIAKVNNISAFNLDLRLDPAKKGKGELAELADTFNNMLDRLETAFQIQNNFVSNASHELRTPLTAILGAVELSLLNPQVNNSKETLELVYKQASRLNDIINGLLKLAQSGYNSKKQLNEVIRLDELIISILDDLSITTPGNQIQLDFSRSPESPNDLAILG
ncbi:MAG: HAMP domain-containing protein, partial [Pedobacter sp.]